MNLTSVDQSLRSTGVCTFIGDELSSFRIIKTKNGDNIYEEDDLLFIWEVLNIELPEEKTFDIVFEGLSMNSKSAKKDLIDGLHWFLRTEFRSYYPDSRIGVISVSEWRNWFTTAEERKKAKEEYSKDYLKKVVSDKIRNHHFSIYNKFFDYIKRCKLNMESLYDLCDAYALGLYRIHLENSKIEDNDK